MLYQTKLHPAVCEQADEAGLLRWSEILPIAQAVFGANHPPILKMRSV